MLRNKLKLKAQTHNCVNALQINNYFNRIITPLIPKNNHPGELLQENLKKSAMACGRTFLHYFYLYEKWSTSVTQPKN